VRFAVIVLREEDKAEAAQRFRTPLLFSVQEAKGLEYENIILWNLVSRARADFADIANGVSPSDLESEFAYARAADKRDKSLERYKFFVNGLYVAMTRAVRRLYVVESDTRHPIFSLLRLQEAATRAEVSAEASSTEEWQREARKLELQGNEAQAQAIRQNVLHERSVPWQVLDPAGLCEAARKALDPECVSSKLRRRLLEYAEIYRERDLTERLVELGVADEGAIHPQSSAAWKRHVAGFDAKNPKEVLRLVDEYGADYRSPFNFTPLMLAAEVGNVELARALVARGADTELVDNAGRNALHLALGRAAGDAAYAANALPGLWSLLAPTSVSLQLDEQLVKIDAHLIEYVLFQLMYALQRDHLFALYAWHRGMRSVHLLKIAQRLPPAALRVDRRRRDYLNGVLARNEVGRDYPYNRRLFLRVAHGHYVLNPRLELRIGTRFTPIYDVMGVRRMAELGLSRYVAASRLIAAKLAQSGHGRGAEARGADS
jgi:hypothetical protein